MIKRFGISSLVVALLSVIVTVVATADFNLAGTDGTGPHRGDSDFASRQPGLGLRPERPLPDAVKSVIDPKSAQTLRLADNSLELEIPESSFEKALEISIEPLRAPGGSGVKVFQQWSLEATDLSDQKSIHQFSKDITLKSVFRPDDIRGMDWNSLTFVWFNPETSTWDPIPTEVDFESRTMTAKTDHFSIYGTQAASAYALPGQIMDFQVNLNSGASSYSYPIQLPPGRGGFQPLNLAFNYNSGSVDEMKNKRDLGSMAGIGWSLDLPHMFYNEEKDEYSLVLDGVSGKLVQDGSTSRWYTETYSPAYIEQIDTSGDISWEITTANGTLYTFETTRSRWPEESACNIEYIYRWDLDSAEDVHGNRFEITWQQDLKNYGGSGGCDTVRAAYPDEIKAVDGGTTLWSAKFVYSTVNNVASSYSGLTVRKDTPATQGSVTEPIITETRTLTSVKVQDGESTPNTIREYVIGTSTTDDLTGVCNQFNPAGEHTLTSITLKGVDGGTLQTTSFTYEDRENRYFDTDQAIQSDTSANCTNPGNPYFYDRPYLSKVENGYGAEISFTYETRRPLAFSNEWTRQVVSRIVANPDSNSATDGVPIVTDYEYLTESGEDAVPAYVITSTSANAEYRGFQLVKVISGDGSYTLNRFFANSGSVSHPIHGSTSEDLEKLKGKSYEQERFSADGTRITRNVTNWDVSTTGLPTGVHKTLVADSGTQIFDSTGATESSKSWQFFEYDIYDNVITERRLGNYAITTDDVTVHRDFVYNTTHPDWIVRTVKNERLYEGDVPLDPDEPGNPSATKIGETRFYYDGLSYGASPTTGNLTKVDSYSGASTFASTTYTYDSTYGVRLTSTDPFGETTSFAYDTVLRAFVTTTTLPAVGADPAMTVQTVYDMVADGGHPAGILRGLVESQIDENGEETLFAYDEFGRITSLSRPGDDLTNPSLKFSYLSWGTNGQQRIETEAKISDSPATYAKRQEFFDGFGRVVQALEPGATPAKKSVLGTVKFDNTGRVVNSFTPWEVADTVNAYQSPYDALNATSVTESAGVGASVGTGDYSWGSTVSTGSSDNVYANSSSAGLVNRNTGWLEPDHVDEYACGACGSWSYLSNLYMLANDDGVYSKSTAPGNGSATPYTGTFYGYFNRELVPADSTINGLELSTKRYNFPGGVRDLNPKIYKPGGQGSIAALGNWSNGTPRVDTLGGSTNLWGTTWTPSDINAGSNQFGFSIIGDNHAVAASTAYVDYAKLRVHYSDLSRSEQLNADNFGFDVPVGARIDGIEVIIERSAETASPAIKDHSLQLVRDGIPVGDDKADTSTAWPTTDTSKTYPTTGGSSDDWGRTWTAEEINSPNFGVQLQVRTESLDEARVDHIQIKVYYTVAKVGSDDLHTSSSTVDAMGRVIAQTGIDGSTVTRSYAAATASGEVWVETVTDPLGNVVMNYTDAFGRLVRIEEFDDATPTQQLFRETRYTYDRAGNLTKVEVDPVEVGLDTVVSEMEYDWLGRKASHLDPDIGVPDLVTPANSKRWLYEYDANGNLTKQTDARGTVIVFEYDELNRETQRCATSCTTGTVLATFGYDDTANGNAGTGRRTSASTGTNLVEDTYFYDERGRVVQQSRELQGTSYATRFTYDPADRLLSTTLPNGEVVSQAYDQRGLPEGLSSGIIGDVISSSVYNVLDLPTEVTLGNGIINAREYWGIDHPSPLTTEQFGQLYRIRTYTPGSPDTDHVDLRLEWDVNGNLTSREDALASSIEIEEFSYDFLNRLTGVSGANSPYTRTYTYDGHDNIASKTGQGTYTYDIADRPHLVSGTTTSGANAYTYDDNGNTTKRPGQTLVWNDQNLLKEVKDSSGTNLIESYLYDADGQRAIKTAGNGDVTHYVSGQYQVEKPAAMQTIALVQSLNNASIGATSVSVNGTWTAGNKLVVTGVFNFGADNPVLSDDGPGLTYTLESSDQVSPDQRLMVWTADNTSSSTFNVTVTVDTANHIGLGVLELSGAATGAAEATDNGFNVGNSQSISATISTLTDGAWVISSMGTHNQFDDTDDPAGYTFVHTYGNGQVDRQYAHVSYKEYATAGTADHTWNWGSWSSDSGIVAVAIAPAGGGPDVSTTTYFHGGQVVATAKAEEVVIGNTTAAANISSENTAGKGFYENIAIDNLSGTIIMSGGYDDVQANNAGAVYVFQDSSGWSQTQKLYSPTPEANGYFGGEHSKLAASDGYFAVGAHGEDVGANVDEGQVHIFKWNGTSWVFDATITNPNGAANDQFGRFLAMDGNLLVVSAFLENVNSPLYNEGAVHVYERQSNGTWEHQKKLYASDGYTNLLFGVNVSVDADSGVIVVGADRWDAQWTANNQGAAYIFERNDDGTWPSTETQRITASDAATDDGFGYSVAVSGHRLVVATPFVDQGASSNTGAAYVFERTHSGWTQVQKITASDAAAGKWFGQFIDLEGDLLAIAAIEHTGSASATGQVYVYQLLDGTFTEVSKLTKQSEAAADRFGSDVDLNDGQLAITIKLHDDGANTDVGGYAVVDLRPSVKDSVQYLHADHLGSPVAATDVFGNVVGTQSFFPFGEVRPSATGVFDTERGFTGQIRDTATGLNFYNARYQDPVLGRFVSPDSIVPNVANPTDFNRFVYVLNSPLVYTDPTGHCPWCVAALVGGAVGAVTGAVGEVVVTVGTSAMDDRGLAWSDITVEEVIESTLIGAAIGSGATLLAPTLGVPAAAAISSAIGQSGSDALDEHQGQIELSTTEAMIRMATAGVLGYAGGQIASGVPGPQGAVESLVANTAEQVASALAARIVSDIVEPRVSIFANNSFTTDGWTGDTRAATSTQNSGSQPNAPRTSAKVFIPRNLFSGEDDTL